MSGASLLSTSIQAAMLFGRILDPPGQPLLFGTVGFLFTDDLDVTNRFYDDLRDAEGGQSRAEAEKAEASPRRPALTGSPPQAVRYRDGQSWDLVKKIGRYLAPDLQAGELRIGRTSSQDAGVDATPTWSWPRRPWKSDSTTPGWAWSCSTRHPMTPPGSSSGGGVQAEPEAPPITVVALSDYGRDRLAYQAYETLFAPEIPARNLPSEPFRAEDPGRSGHAGLAGPRHPAHASPGRSAVLLTAPGSNSGQHNDSARDWLADRLHELLTSRSTQDDLARHLQAALQVSADEVQAVLWEQPRSLLLAVAPTALRRLIATGGR